MPIANLTGIPKLIECLLTEKQFVPLLISQRGGSARGKMVTTAAGSSEVSRSPGCRDELGRVIP
jgi:hypothetical protein